MALAMARFLNLLALVGALLVFSGCAEPLPSPPAAAVIPEVSPPSVEPPEALATNDDTAVVGEADDGKWQGWREEKDRGHCFVWQPLPVSSVKKGLKGRKQETKGGCCQPQSLIYARCRSSIDSCRMGDTSPVQWYACASRNGKTSRQPIAGSIMVLDANGRRKMPTGHPVYVEAIKKNGNNTWQLQISHTNYDRQCRLDQDSMVSFDPVRMTASFDSGPWSSWARDLKVLGFILR